MPDRAITVRGARENTLRDIDVSFGEGVTAVVGVSGSGKSSLVFDTLFNEARRRHLEGVSLGSPLARLRPARVRDIEGLRPSVAIAQNVLNRNPGSTVATAIGVHPVLRLLYTAFARCRCPRCGEEQGLVANGNEQVLSWLQSLVAAAGGELEVVVPLVRRTEGDHGRLLEFLEERFGSRAIEVDGRARSEVGALNPDEPHDVDIRLSALGAQAGSGDFRNVVAAARALGCSQVIVRNASVGPRVISWAPVCAACGEPVPRPRAPEFARSPEKDSYRLGGRTFEEYLSSSVSDALRAITDFEVPSEAARPVDILRTRLSAMESVELGYLPMNRSSPTLSRGEAQRLRLAILLATPVEDLLHVLDEPTIGLDPAQVGSLTRRLGELPGPVVVVEHDRWAVADADEVIELGPGGGSRGGEVTFHGSPAGLWRSRTVTGRWFSGREAISVRPGRPVPGNADRLAIREATANNLRGFDCHVPVGRLTVVTGPSGAGKTTLTRDVLVGSMASGEPRGCAGVQGPPARTVTVDQSPIGRNPRSNPATYTGLAGHIRTRFAAATGLSASAFSFNRSEGACTTCSGMGALELKLPHLASEWLTCETCGGRRFAADVLDVRAELADGQRYTIAELYDVTIERAADLLADDGKCRTVLSCLLDIGLGYLRLGQPSTTLSGGEAQRVKLAKWLTRARAGDLVFLDEPTTGLHPADLSRLIDVLHRLVDRGCTVVVVEHQSDVIDSADWLIRLGPGGGPEGGELLGEGVPDAPYPEPPRPRSRRRNRSPRSSQIEIGGASANNLCGVSVRIPKKAVTAIVGVSGSGKSSLLSDVLETEATRRLLESLSMYERQSVKEVPAADVDLVKGLGPTVAIRPDRHLFSPRNTVGSATDLSFHLGVLLAYAGEGAERPLLPSHFSPESYEAACLTCGGLGSVPEPRPERLIVRPDAPLCRGAMYSPGFFPQSYLSKPENGGYWSLQALAAIYRFDPFETPWNQMSPGARNAFLYGDPETNWSGFFPIVEHWDQGGLYTEHVSCPGCDGGRLRAEFIAVRLGGANRRDLHERPLTVVAEIVDAVGIPDNAPGWVETSRSVALRRLRFLDRVGLGYLHLDRRSATLSAGEAQRVKLASLLGAELSGMTVLLDEPSRGLHPREIHALSDALRDLRDAGNTVVLTDHDPSLVAAADRVLVLGPGAGRDGGRLLAEDSAEARDLIPVISSRPVGSLRRKANGWMKVRGARENNLSGADIDLPLGVLAGICGVSGSGKSTLGIDIVARALDPPRLTTSVAYENVNAGAHDGIEGAPQRTVYSDQSRSGIHSPGRYLGATNALRKAYAESPEARDVDLSEKDLAPGCDGCHGRGFVQHDMGFLPPVVGTCDACEGTGYHHEARHLVVRGHSLPALEDRTLAEVADTWRDHTRVAGPLEAACSLGLGYLRLGQPRHSLSSGEAQRLKLARELHRQSRKPTLFILDEPTVGLHPKDVARLRQVFDGLVGAGHSVVIIEHDPMLLACCDWLVELGPGGGPNGGRVIGSGTPEELAAGRTPSAAGLAQVLS